MNECIVESNNGEVDPDLILAEVTNSVDLGGFRLLWPDLQDGETIEVRCFPAGPGTPVQRFCTTEEEICQCLARYRASHHCCAGVGLRRGENGGSADVTRVAVLWADVDLKHFDDADDPEWAANTAVGDFPLRPSLVVATGGGLHTYWFLEEPFELTTGADRLRF